MLFALDHDNYICFLYLYIYFVVIHSLTKHLFLIYMKEVTMELNNLTQENLLNLISYLLKVYVNMDVVKVIKFINLSYNDDTSILIHII